MAQSHHPRGPQRGETQFVAQPKSEDCGPIATTLGCILGFLTVGIPVLFLGSLALYGFLHDFGTTTSSTSTYLPSDQLPPNFPSPPQPYYARFQIYDSNASDAPTLLTVKDEFIRIITVSDAAKIPREKSEAAARGAVVDGVRPTVLIGAFTVTVAPLEQKDQFTSVLLFADGNLRQALLEQVGKNGFPRPPPGFEIQHSHQSLPPEISLMVEAAFRRPLPIREIYIVGHVQEIHAPLRFQESRATTNVIDLDVRVHSSQIAEFERRLAKYVDDTRRYEHRYDWRYIDIEGEQGNRGHGEFKTEHIEHPVEIHPRAIP